MAQWGTLRRRIKQRDAKLVVVGQGYVGLSVACGAAVEGFQVTGVDLDADRVADLSAGHNTVPGVADATFLMAAETGRLTFSTDASVVADAEVILICVPTPLIEHRPQLQPVISAATAVGEHIREGSLVVLESTTYPGTTEQVVKPLIEKSGLKVGKDVLLAYSPERIDPGNDKFGLRNTPRIVGGSTTDATETAATFYAQVVDRVEKLSSCRAAEMAKLLENTFRMVNIALVNELAMLCAEQGIDTWEVISAAATKPFGYMPFYPGPGVGGHCIPLDPTYLTWQSRRDTGKPYRIVELANDVNTQMPEYVANRIVAALNESGKSVKGAEILALGLTYKPDVGDIRESPSLEVVSHLARRGARIRYNDPFLPRVDSHGMKLRRTALTDEAIKRADVVVVLTPHQDFDLSRVADRARLVFDARDSLHLRNRKNVVTL